METVLKWKLWTPVHLWQTCYLFLVSLYDTHYKPNYPKAHSFLVNFVSTIMMDRKWFHVNQHIFPTLPYRQMKLRRIRSMQKRGVYSGVEGVTLFLVWWGTYEPGCGLSALVKEVRGCLIVWLLQPWGHHLETERKRKGEWVEPDRATWPMIRQSEINMTEICVLSIIYQLRH